MDGRHRRHWRESARRAFGQTKYPIRQAVVAIANHADSARSITIQNGNAVADSHTTMANAKRPALPNVAPAASRAAACRPRRLPCKPLSRFRRRSCASMRVALARKIAGNARKRPPRDGPPKSATRPARQVASPPSVKRTRYSYQRLSFSAENLRWIIS